MAKPLKQFREAGEKIGREGMSLMAQRFVSEYDGSYKGAMELCGKLSVIAKMATCDSYWREQAERGIQKAESEVEIINEAAFK